MTDIVVHYRRQFSCNVAHSLTGDPRSKTVRDHGHQMIVIVDSGSDEHWAKIQRWLDEYVDYQQLAAAFAFTTFPAAIARYLHTVFAQFDPALIAVDVDMDACGRAVATAARDVAQD